MIEIRVFKESKAFHSQMQNKCSVSLASKYSIEIDLGLALFTCQGRDLKYYIIEWFSQIFLFLSSVSSTEEALSNQTRHSPPRQPMASPCMDPPNHRATW